LSAPFPIPNGVTLTVVAVDEEYMLLSFAAADGQFAGSTELYGREHAQDLAAALRDFPRSPNDRRQLRLGSTDPRVADGFVEIDALCLDRAGNAALEIAITDKAVRSSLKGRQVRVHLAVEPPAIDVFVAALLSWSFEAGSSVVLRGAA
jgi:hypothetical protein